MSKPNLGTNMRMVTVGLILGLASGFACARTESTPATAEQPGIAYEMDGQAELTKGSWYIQDGILWVDVSFKNAGTAETTYDVSVKVDDWPWGAGDKPPQVKPGGQATVKIYTGSSAQPGRIWIKVQSL